MMDPAVFANFNGGITEHTLNGPVNKYARADNLLIVKFTDTVGRLESRPGSELYDEDDAQIPAGAQRIGHLEFFGGQLLAQSSRNVYNHDGTSWGTLTGPSGNLVFPAGVDTTTVMTTSPWNDHLFGCSDGFTKPFKLYKDGAGTMKLRTAGMPELATSPACTPGAGANVYTYAFFHRYEYTVGTTVFVDEGPITEVQVSSAAEPSASTMAITAIPVLANGATDNYETTAVTIQIYRTVANGSDFFKTGQVTNGTTTFNDTRSDASLDDQEPLYTTGGVVENDPPPLCKVLHIVGDTGFYGHTKVGAEVFKNEILQSIPGKIDSVPGDFSASGINDGVVAISSARAIVVALCDGSAYRLDGRYDELGRGGIVAERISDRAGCIGPKSVVQTLEGVFWWGYDGIYFTDGFRVVKVNEDWTRTYEALVDTAEKRRRVVGSYDGSGRRIWWSVQAEGTECDKCYILDLNWGLSSTMPFTTASGGENDYFAPTATCFNSGNLVRADRRGYVFQHAYDTYTDPRVDTLETPADWDTATVVWDFESCAFSAQVGNERMYIPSITLQAKNRTNVSIQVTSINDDGAKEADLKPIRYRGNFTWGDPTFVWGDPTFVWNATGLVEEFRRFPGNHLRCSYKTIGISNAHAVVANSNVYGNCNVDSTLKTATLTDTATYDWPASLLDYYVAFESNWDQEFLITERTDDTITFQDTSDLATTNLDQEWEIRGRPKGEAFGLIAYTLHFATWGKTQDYFTKTEQGKATGNT